MKFALSVIFTLISIVLTVFICVSGVMDHWSITSTHIFMLIIAVSLASYFITQGAYESLEEEGSDQS